MNAAATVVLLDIGPGVALDVTESVAEIREAADEAMRDESLIELHRADDLALVAIDPFVIQFVAPAPSRLRVLEDVVPGWPA